MMTRSTQSYLTVSTTLKATLHLPGSRCPDLQPGVSWCPIYRLSIYVCQRAGGGVASTWNHVAGKGTEIGHGRSHVENSRDTGNLLTPREH
jgi:hypothetical protein